jgi:transcriptional regulator with XRE-family HTH domain
MNFFESVGRNILHILDEQNKTQSALAEEIGISRQVMLKITKGTKAINALEISKIANVLNVTIERITKPCIEQEDHFVMFMGEIENIDVKEKFDFLNGVIDEIVHLEDDLNEQS